MNVTAFVLAGGQSSRMGSNKALLPWGDEILLTRALATAQAVCSRTIICGPRSLYSKFGSVIEDALPGRGPLAGIQSALHATETDLNLILSVDLPLMPAEFLAWLLQQADSGGDRGSPRRRLADSCSRYALFIAARYAIAWMRRWRKEI